MVFAPGHEKRGGRKPGTPNRASGAGREVAALLLDDPEYQRSLRKRLIRGEAPRLELLIWELRYGKPRVEASELPRGADPTTDLVQLLETLGDNPNRQPVPPVVDLHDGKEDPAPPASAPREANGEKN